MNLVQSIRSGVWMLEESTFQAYLPLALRLMKGEKVEFSEQKHLPFAVRAGSDQQYNMDTPPPKSVAVHYVIGPITQYDQYCGPDGMETLVRQMRSADSRDNIIAHVMHINSGGGEANYMETAARAIKDLKKPVLVHISGMAASAGYYLAAAADEIYTSESTDIVGSIGVMISFMDVRGFFEKEGIKLHEVYAEPSDMKNKTWQEALDGNYDQIKTDLLNPYAEQFITTVKEFRPQISAEDAFRGRTYMTPEAKSVGLIDGQMTLEQVIERAFTIVNDQQKQDLTMKEDLTVIESALGYKLESKDGGVFLNADEIAIVANNISAATPEEVAAQAEVHTNLTAEVAQLRTSVEALNTRMEEAEANQITLENQLIEFGQKPGAKPTSVATEEDTPLGEPDALMALENSARAAATNGGGIRIVKN